MCQCICSGNPDEIFKEIDPQALASASIGQVHRAWLKDGTAVVIKVQHADVEALLSHDMKNLQQLSWGVSVSPLSLPSPQHPHLPLCRAVLHSFLPVLAPTSFFFLHVEVHKIHTYACVQIRTCSCVYIHPYASGYLYTCLYAYGFACTQVTEYVPCSRCVRHVDRGVYVCLILHRYANSQKEEQCPSLY